MEIWEKIRLLVEGIKAGAFDKSEIKDANTRIKIYKCGPNVIRIDFHI